MSKNPPIEFLLALIIAALSVAPAEAALYRSYTFDAWGEAVPIPDPYLPVRVIFGHNLGVGDFQSPQDIFVAPDQTLFIVDSGNHRIVRVTSDYKLVNIYKEFDNNGTIDGFKNPLSVFVTKQGHLFVADTDNERIVHLDENGNLVSIITKPETEISQAFPRHFRFRPKKLAVDQFNRLYVIIDGLYEGLMEMDVEGNFRTFTGAPRVSLSLWQYFWMRVASDEQRQRMQLFLPTEYSSMHLDDMGFILTTIAATTETKADHYVRRLSPAGADVLMRVGMHPVIGDIDQGMGTSIEGPSRFVDIIGRENGIYSVLDQQRGRIFTYDVNGNLLYVFGGLGQGVGLFVRPVAIEEYNGQILVLDNRTNSITVFAPTDYTKLIHMAIDAYNRGGYNQAAELWQEVIALNCNCELAFSGVADAEFGKGNYAQAMLYYKLANNRPGYSKAFYRYRRQLLGERFDAIMTSLVVIAGVLYLAAKRRWPARLRRRYRNSQLAAAVSGHRIQGSRLVGYLKQTWRAMRYATHVIFHPADGFWDLKYESRGTVSAANVLLFLVVVSYIFMRQYTGFALNYNKVEELNVVMEAASIILPFSLWCLVNWALTTLMDGKGRMKDIYIAGAYALTPLILINIPITILSNYITIEEGTFYYLFLAIGMIWALLLLFLGTGITHDYSVSKSMFTTLATIVGIGIVCFIGLLFFHVIDTVAQFVQEMYRELTFRL